MTLKRIILNSVKLGIFRHNMQMEKEALLKYVSKSFRASERYLQDAHDSYRMKQKFCWEGKQWDDREYQERITYGRRTITINMLPRYVNQILNDARLSIPTIKIKSLQVDGDEVNDKNTKVLDSIVSHIQVKGNAQIAYSTALKSAISGGYGFCKLAIDYIDKESFDLALIFERVIDPTMVFYDVSSEAIDASDWNYCIVKKLYTKEDFKLEYDNNPDELNTMYYDVDSLPDKTQEHESSKYIVYEAWIKEKTKNIMFLSLDGNKHTISMKEFKEHFGMEPEKAKEEMMIDNYRDVQDSRIYRVNIYNHHILDEIEWPGTMIPVIPIWGEEYISVNNKRMFRSAIDDSLEPQREYNFHRSAEAEMKGLQPLAPLLMPKGSIAEEDRNDWEESNLKPKVFLEFDPDVGGNYRPQRLPYSQISAGEQELSFASSNDLKETSGLSDASIGKRSNEVSGRAILARQRKGEIGTYVFNENMKNAMIYIGRLLIEAIPKVYKDQQAMKIVGQDLMGNRVTKDLDLSQMDWSVGKYDVFVEIGYGTMTQRDEVRENLILMMERLGPEAAAIIAPKFVQLLNFPGSDDIAKLFEVMLPPPVQNILRNNDEIENMGKDEIIFLFKRMEMDFKELEEQMQQMQQMMQMQEIEHKQDMEKEKLKSMTDIQEALIRANAQVEAANAKVMEV